MKTTEEIITLITTKLMKAEDGVDLYWKAYKEAMDEKDDKSADTYHSLFLEQCMLRNAYKDLLKEIFKNEK